ncbi:MAG: ABC transporter ATP-binding protein [Synergistaceae bacterium]|jgi:iron complex transport system ATP-binding protein|nr:ABC transporter ATP-binding protein [Synergistaceae bacterium]
MILDVQGVRFRYGSEVILDGITFSARRGEVVIILGPNGAGKSTLLRCLDGLTRPDEGTILLDGRPLAALDGPSRARAVGYVPQRPEAAGLIAFDAVLLGRRPYFGSRVSQKDLRRVDAVFRTLDMEHLALRPLDAMSGGELQKVTLARALAQEPSLLLLDEPTSNLDMKNQVEILSLLRHIARGHDMAVVATLHDLNLAFRFGDRFLFLKEGRIVQALNDRSGLSADLVEEVYGLSVDVGHHQGLPFVVPKG